MSTTEIQYRHVRRDLIQDGQLVKANNGGVTFAISGDKRWYDLPADHELQVGVAVCSDADNFCYERGRAIATGRLKQNRCVTVSVQALREMAVNGCTDSSLAHLRAALSV